MHKKSWISKRLHLLHDTMFCLSGVRIYQKWTYSEILLASKKQCLLNNQIRFMRKHWTCSIGCTSRKTWWRTLFEVDFEYYRRGKFLLLFLYFWRIDNMSLLHRESNEWTNQRRLSVESFSTTIEYYGNEPINSTIFIFRCDRLSRANDRPTNRKNERKFSIIMKPHTIYANIKICAMKFHASPNPIQFYFDGFFVTQVKQPTEPNVIIFQRHEIFKFGWYFRNPQLFCNSSWKPTGELI